MKQRSSIDIMGEILYVANKRSGIGKTKIMYKAYLSYSQLKEYLPILIERGLLSFDADSQSFKTTKKGLKFLDTCSRIGDAMKIPSSIR
jgi:predicted transcriptional regulator